MPTKGRGKYSLSKKTSGQLRKVFTTKIIVSCVAIALLVVTAVFLCFFPPMKPASQISDSSNLKMSEGLANGAELRQGFIAPIDADSLGIYFSNYDVFLDSGYLDIKISQGSSEIFHQSVDVDQLHNGQFFYIGCSLVAGNTYEINISIHDLEKIDRVAFMTSSITDGDSLMINETRQNSNLVLSYVNHIPDYFAIWYCVFGITLIAIYIVLFVNQEAYEK